MTTLGLGMMTLMLVPAVLAAQAPEQNSFYLTHGTDTIIVERMSRTATELRGEFVDRARGGLMQYVATLTPDASISKLSIHYYRTADDNVGDTATFTIAGDHITAQMGSAAAVSIPAVDGALPIINPSVAFLEQLLLHAKAMHGPEKVVVPVFIVGTPQPMPATVTAVGKDSVTLRYASVTMVFAISPDGHIQSGVVPAQQVSVTRGPALGKLLSVRRDYSAPRNAPYTAEDVVVHTPSGLKLTGTLTVPKARASGRAPAVITITGSGSEDRDEQAAALPNYRPFREIADTLGRRGIAVLRLDDRGINGSDIGPRTATSADFADDIRAGIAYLRSRDEIDRARIGIIGHSEGGIIAPMIAETDSSIRALVLLAAPASPGRAIVTSQQHYVIDTVMKLTGARREAALEQSRRATDSLARAGWGKWFLEHDPLPTARHVRTPVLILQGENDHQVPSPEAEKLAAAFRSAGNTRVDVRLFPETNHLFVRETIGGFSYEKLPSLAVRKDVLGAIADWLNAVLR
jgi:alpha-beta hydrolase superfamily lysophospholipase